MARHLARPKAQLQHPFEESLRKRIANDCTASTNKQVLFGLEPKRSEELDNLISEVQNSPWEYSLVHRTEVQ